jgi:hypothetical protein
LLSTQTLNFASTREPNLMVLLRYPEIVGLQCFASV